MKTNCILLLAALACFLLAASCQNAPEVAAVATAVGVSMAGVIDALAPLIPPEQLAKLQATAASVDGTVQATQAAVSTIADAIAQLRSGTSTQLQQQAEGLNRAMQQLASMPSREETYLVTSGTGAAATAASRLLSRLKHGKP